MGRSESNEIRQNFRMTRLLNIFQIVKNVLVENVLYCTVI